MIVRVLLITCLILNSEFLLRAQDNFQISYSAGGGDVIEWIIPSNDGNLVLAGNTNSFDPSGDGLIMKTDRNGNIIWSEIIGGDGLDQIDKIISCSDGGYVAVGYTTSFGQGDWDAWITRIDEDGVVKWSYCFGTPTRDGARGVIQTKDGGFVVVGQTNEFENAFMLSLNSQGNLLWKKEITLTYIFWFNDVFQTSSGGFFFTGAMNYYGFGIHDTFIFETDSAMNFIRGKAYGDQENDSFRTLIPYQDGFLAVGDSWSWYGHQYGWIAKLGADLMIEKAVVLGDNTSNQFLESVCFISNSIYAAIQLSGKNSFILELDSALNLKKSWKYNPGYSSYSSHIISLDNNYLMVSGSYAEGQSLPDQIYLAGFNPADTAYDCNIMPQTPFIGAVTVQSGDMTYFENPTGAVYQKINVQSAGAGFTSRDLCLLLPVADFSGPGQACVDEPVSFINNCEHGVTYHWTFEGAVPASSDSANPGIIIYENPGYYSIKLVVSNEYGADSMIRYITVYPLPEVYLGEDTTLQPGQTLLLNPGPGMDNYLWQDGSSGQTYEVTENGTYWVVVGKNLCFGSDTIVIKYNDCTADFSSPEQACANTPVIITNESLFGNTYQWYFDGAIPATGNSAEPGTIMYENPGIYDIKLVVSNGGMADSLVRHITIYPDITFDLGPDTTIFHSASLQFVVVGGYDSYLWSTGAMTSYLSISGSDWHFGNNQVWLQITNGPCIASDTINIYVIAEEDYDDIRLYPNPAWEFSQITIKARQVPHTLVFYNKLGQKVLTLHPLVNSFNIMGLEPGAYVVELLFHPNRVLRRFIVL